MRGFLTIALAVLTVMGSPTEVDAQQDFIGCGQVVQGVSCLLFEVPTGEQYILDSFGGFPVGSIVLVSGSLEVSCISICLQGDGCIFQNTIEPCPPFSGCGTIVDDQGCLVLDADDGNSYTMIGDPTGFVPGQTVMLEGVIDEFCSNTCGTLGGDGCVFYNVITDCVVSDPAFQRGDADNNGTVSPLQDGLFVLNFGFGGGPSPACMDAADVDGSGFFSALIDGLYLLNWGFLGGTPPPAPFPDCDLGSEVLGCDSTSC